MADIKSLKQNGVVFYPLTTPEAVIDADGKTVLDLINAVEAGEGTKIAVGGVDVDSISFTSDPQTQLNALSNSVANNTSNIALKANIADVYSTTDADLTFATKVDLASKADTTVTNALATDVLNINSNVTALSNRVTANETEITNLSSSITTLDDDVSDINDEITTLKTQVSALEGGITFESVTTLPEIADAKTNVIYLVPNTSGSKDEYLLVDGAWELIGTTDVDLSGYMATVTYTADGIILESVLPASVKNSNVTIDGVKSDVSFTSDPQTQINTINSTIGDIDTILDTINGEVV